MSRCSRRDVLRGLGLIAVQLPFAESCGGTDNSGLGEIAACGSQMCMDLTRPANASLQNVNGSVIANAPNGDTLVVIRTSSTDVIALSAICTHAGCLVSFDSLQGVLACPCHGSVYAETGQVRSGPAPLPLTRYTATLSGNQVLIG